MICQGPGARSVSAGEQQARDGEHFGMGDHVAEHGRGSGERGTEAVVSILPAFGEREIPAGGEPLAGDVPACRWARATSWPGTFAVRLSWRSWLSVTSGKGRQAGTVDATQPLLMPDAQVVAGPGADDHHAGDVSRGA